MPPCFFYLLFLHCHGIEAPSARCVALVCEVTPRKRQRADERLSLHLDVSHRGRIFAWPWPLSLEFPLATQIQSSMSERSPEHKPQGRDSSGSSPPLFLPGLFSSLINCNWTRAKRVWEWAKPLELGPKDESRWMRLPSRSERLQNHPMLADGGSPQC